MAHQTMRVNLTAVVFPFTTGLWGRSIMVPQYDENYERVLSSSSDIGKDKGVALACYLHNCMPTTEGYQAIGYMQNAKGVIGETAFDRCFPLLYVAPQDAHFLFSPAGGKNYIYDAMLGGWSSISPFPSGTIGSETIISTAYVQGNTYIYFDKIGCFSYDQINKVLTAIVLSGLVTSTIIGICSSFGYLIAFNETSVAWSNATLPTDFVPSLVTGAGGGSVNDIKGNIVCCVPINGGFIVYCEKNILAAKYTGNIRFPFIFKEIPDSGGITSPDQVTINSNGSEHYAWTSSGLQKISISNAELIFPEASDFLSKLIFEDFDDTTLVFTELNLTAPLFTKIAEIADRFIVISYGVNQGVFTHALVYDEALKRWGKLKITHVCAFQWSAPNLYGAVTYDQLLALGLTYDDLANITYNDLSTSINTPEISLKTLSFLQQDGTVWTVDFDLSETGAFGTLMLGKFQFQRNKFITHQYTDFENVDQNAPFSAYIITTLDGKTFQPAVPMVTNRVSPSARRFGKRITGQNYSLLFQGAFAGNSVLTDFTLGGDR